MIGRVRKFMEQWNMVRPGDTVVAGVSGGADSVCLLLVLKELAADMNFTLEAVHVEHGLRGGESERDAEFVRRLCDLQRISLVTRHVDVPQYAAKHSLGTEEAARILRYRVFADIAQKLPADRGRIALAHQREDNAETMLMALARGTGLDGLCGMPPIRQDAGFCYIRPLLTISRESVEAFLTGRGQSYCTDSTNLDTKYTRNYVRKEVLPLIAQINPQAAAHMSRTAAQLRDLREFMEQAADEVYARVVKSGAQGELWLDVDGLEGLPSALRERVVHRAVGEVAGARKDIGAVHIEAVLGLLGMQSGRRVELPYRIEAVREYDRIRLCAKRTECGACSTEEHAVTWEQLRELRANGGTMELSLGHGKGLLVLRTFDYNGKTEEISTKNCTKWFDYDMIKDGFLVRNRRSGDFLVIDASGHRKKLSDYFVDEKLPARRRDEVLLLVSGHEVFWLIGGRMGRSGMVTERTRTVLEITCKGEEGYGLQEGT